MYSTITDFIKQTIYGLDITNGQVRVGVVTYSTQINDYFFLNQYNNLQSLINAISFNQISGRSNTQAALQFVQVEYLTTINGKRMEIPSAVILMSDGYSNVLEGSSPVANAGKSLRMSGATIYTVALGDSPNTGELLALASSPTSMHIYGLTSGNATTTANALLTQLCAN